LRTRRISASLRAHTICNLIEEAQAADRIWLITRGHESQLTLTLACIKLLTYWQRRSVEYCSSEDHVVTLIKNQFTYVAVLYRWTRVESLANTSVIAT